MKRSLILIAAVAASACNGGKGSSKEPETCVAAQPVATVEVPKSSGPTGPLPDLVVDAEMLGATWYIDEVNPESPFYDCAVAEGCIVRGQGNRRLLKFDVGVINRGDADLALGSPYDHPEDFEYAPCHDHLHYKDFATYQLSGSCGVAVGIKQAFCLVDLYDWDGDGDQVSSGYDCADQGISMGWGDIYDSSLDCQWIDVTDLRPGQYTLTVDVNGDRKIPEGTAFPNTASVTITID